MLRGAGRGDVAAERLPQRPRAPLPFRTGIWRESDRSARIEPNTIALILDFSRAAMPVLSREGPEPRGPHGAFTRLEHAQPPKDSGKQATIEPNTIEGQRVLLCCLLYQAQG